MMKFIFLAVFALVYYTHQSSARGVQRQRVDWKMTRSLPRIPGRQKRVAFLPQQKPPLSGKSVLCRLRHRLSVVDLNNEYVKCVGTCPKNHKEIYSLNWGHYCKPIVIPTGCQDQYCTQCKEGYKMTYNSGLASRCVKECPSGYFETSKSCEVCLVRDCQKCATTWKCSNCNQGFYLQRTIMGSILCVDICSPGFSKNTVHGIDQCLKDKKPETTTETTESYKDTFEETTIATVTTTTTTSTTTLAPPEGCVDKLCMMCQDGYFKFITQYGASTCVTKCPAGFTPLGSICIACSDNKCASCPTSIAECEKCQPGFSMLKDSTNITTMCVRYCPQGYNKEKIDGAYTCTKEEMRECPISNCESCLQSSSILPKGCGKCKPGFKLFRGALNDHCYKSCPPQYYSFTEKETNATTCAKCEVAFCNICNKPDTCDVCLEPMVLDVGSGKCGFCKPYTIYSYAEKKCVTVDLNQSESNEISGNYW